MAKRRSKPAGRRKPSFPAPSAALGLYPDQVIAARELFWHNVMREMLTSLSTLCALRSETPPEDELSEEAKADAAAKGEPAFDPALFDGRLAVITRAGERVAIADVFPLFACGINTPRERGLSIALECTVFQIRTPDGHVYTLPLHEIRAFHALTPELMRKLERVARRRRPGTPIEEDVQPFGFAAFTSLVHGPPRPLEPAPQHPTE